MEQKTIDRVYDSIMNLRHMGFNAIDKNEMVTVNPSDKSALDKALTDCGARLCGRNWVFSDFDAAKFKQTPVTTAKITTEIKTPGGVWQQDARGKWRFITDPSWHPTPGATTIHATIKKTKRKAKSTRINIDSNENAYSDGSEKEGYTDPDAEEADDE